MVFGAEGGFFFWHFDSSTLPRRLKPLFFLFNRRVETLRRPKACHINCRSLPLVGMTNPFWEEEWRGLFLHQQNLLHAVDFGEFDFDDFVVGGLNFAADEGCFDGEFAVAAVD